MGNWLEVEVAYAKANEQVLLAVKATNGYNIRQVIESSGILNRFSEIDLTRNTVGIFGKIVDLETIPQSGDRIEIYRPLIADPKEQRKLRAAAGKAMKKRN